MSHKWFWLVWDVNVAKVRAWGWVWVTLTALVKLLNCSEFNNLSGLVKLLNCSEVNNLSGESNIELKRNLWLKNGQK